MCQTNHILKLKTPGRNANCDFQSRYLWEEDLPRQPTPTRVALESARQLMWAIQEISGPVIMNAFIMALDKP